MTDNASDITARQMPEAGEDAGGARMHEAYEKIRGAILAGMYRPGVRLSQVKISEELGLSRTPVREALRMIEKEGLLTSARGRQVVISPTSMADLDELYALRIKLDTSTVRATVPDLADADIAEMADCLATMEAHEAPGDFSAFDRAHRQFHAIAIRPAGPRHAEFSARLNEHAERYRRLYLVAHGSYEDSRAEHRAIMAACASRNGAEVAVLLAEHYARIALTIIARIDPLFEPRLVRAAVRFARQDGAGAARKAAAKQRTAQG